MMAFIQGNTDLLRVGPIALVWVPDGGTAAPGLYLWNGPRCGIARWVVRIFPWFGRAGWDQ